MIAQEVIDKVDRLKPNAYSAEDKLFWISDVDTYLRAEIMPEYGTAEINTTPGVTVYPLPAGISFHDILYVWINGSRVHKIKFDDNGIVGDESSISLFSASSIPVKIVYIVSYPRYRYINYVSGDGEIIFGSNFIETTGADFTFYTEDTVIVSGCSVNANNNKEAKIKGGTTTKLIVDDDTFVPGLETGSVTIARVLNDGLLAYPPYDKIYEMYIYAMIDFNNRDYAAYNNNLAMYNNTLEQLMKSYKQRSPIDTITKITNIW